MNDTSTLRRVEPVPAADDPSPATTAVVPVVASITGAVAAWLAGGTPLVCLGMAIACAATAVLFSARRRRHLAWTLLVGVAALGLLGPHVGRWIVVAVLVVAAAVGLAGVRGPAVVRGLASGIGRGSGRGASALAGRLPSIGTLPWSERLDSPVGGLLAGSFFFPLFLALASSDSTVLPRLVGWYNDYPRHLDVAARLGLDPVVVPPHPVFHIATRVGSVFVSAPVAAAFAMAVCAGLAFVGLRRLGLRPSATTPALGRVTSMAFAAAVLVGETPAVLLARTEVVPPLSNFAAYHLWNSPTETLSLAATLLMLPVLLDALDGRIDSTDRRRWVLLAALAGFATLAKPAFTLMLVPAIPLFLLLTGGLARVERRNLAVHFAVPVLSVAMVQMAAAVVFAPEEFRSGVTLAPFAVVEEFGIGASGPVYFLGAGILLIGALCGGARYFRDTGVGVSAVALLLALVPLVLLRETGPLAGDGNVAKLASSCWTVLVVTSARFVASEVLERVRSGARSAASAVLVGVSAVFAAAAVMSGLIVWQVIVLDGSVG